MGRTPQGGDCRSHTTHVFYVDRHRQTALREAVAASSACGSRRRKIHEGLSPWRSRTPARWPCLVSPPSDTVKGCLDAHPGIGYRLSSFRTGHPGPRAAAHRASRSDKPQVPPGLRSLACFTLPVVRPLLPAPALVILQPRQEGSAPSRPPQSRQRLPNRVPSPRLPGPSSGPTSGTPHGLIFSVLVTGLDTRPRGPLTTTKVLKGAPFLP